MLHLQAVQVSFHAPLIGCGEEQQVQRKKMRSEVMRSEEEEEEVHLVVETASALLGRAGELCGVGLEEDEDEDEDWSGMRTETELILATITYLW